MECKACCVRSHQRLPLHRIKVFVRTLLTIRSIDHSNVAMDRRLLSEDYVACARASNPARSCRPALCHSGSRPQRLHRYRYDRYPPRCGQFLQMRASHFGTTTAPSDGLVPSNSSLSSNLRYSPRSTPIPHHYTYRQTVRIRILPGARKFDRQHWCCCTQGK